MTVEEAKKLALKLPNIALPILKDWNEDLKVGIISNNDKRLVTSILNADYNELIKLHSEGYYPSHEILGNLRPYYSTEMQVAINKIFDLPIIQENISEISSIGRSTATTHKEQSINI